MNVKKIVVYAALTLVTGIIWLTAYNNMNLVGGLIAQALLLATVALTPLVIAKVRAKRIRDAEDLAVYRAFRAEQAAAAEVSE